MDKELEFYYSTIVGREPFNALQIKPCKVVDKHCEWVEPKDAEFYGVYGRSEEDNLFYCIADCRNPIAAAALVAILNTISRYTLPLID